MPARKFHTKQRVDRITPKIPLPRKETNKTVLVAFITLGVLLFLLLFLFFSEQFVGKAIQYTVPEQNQAGIFVLRGEEVVNQRFVVPIKANIPTPAVGVRFTLQYPLSLTPDCSTLLERLDRRFITSGKDLSVIRTATCAEGVITFEYGGLCADAQCSNALVGEEVVITEIPFTAEELGTFPLSFTSFTILDLQDSTINLVGEVIDADLTIVAPSALALGQESEICVPEWSCPNGWSYCNATLQQSRMCFDDNHCNPPPQDTKVEVRSCPSCLELWVCTAWSSCQDEMQTRVCNDQHRCGTTTIQPALERSCLLGSASEPESKRADIEPSELPSVSREEEQTWSSIAGQEPASRPSSTRPPQSRIEQPQPSTQVFWRQKSGMLVISIGLGMVMLILVFIFMVVRHRHPHLMYNVDELQEWVRQEKAHGTSFEDITQILKQHTGWKDREIERAFTQFQR